MELNKWIKENIIQDENGEIYLTDIQKKLKRPFTGREIGRAMQQVFKGLTVKSVRNKQYWVKVTKLYLGVGWKEQHPVTVCKPANYPLTLVDQNISKEPEIETSFECDHSSSIKLIESTHQDLDVVLNTVTGSDFLDKYGLNAKMKSLLLSQLKLNNISPKARRWPTEIIRLCLTLYCRSPKSYEYLSNSGFLILPSTSQIIRYKNRVNQSAGFNNDVLQWMKNEAELQKITREGCQGGLLIDEMTIQDDLQLKKVGDEFQLIGFVECCTESAYFEKLCGKESLKLATHVLQLLFIGHSGFRFPVAHFPTTQATPQELYLIFWKAVKKLGLYGFNISYLSLDGAQSNRLLMKILLPECNSSKRMTTMLVPNVFDPNKPKISIIMDYSHVIKKIRNNISKSGHMKSHKKLLELNNKYIIWDHWIKAYQWDVSVNTFKIHQKLTQDHLFLNSQLKMRNSLAEDVLGANMLHLIKKYQETLPDDKANELESTVQLLNHTSVLVSFFRDKRPITCYKDTRLHELRNILDWFKDWETKIYSTEIKNKEKCLFSYQTREDIISCLLGFNEMCQQTFTSSYCSVVPARINSDAIENIFFTAAGYSQWSQQ